MEWNDSNWPWVPKCLKAWLIGFQMAGSPQGHFCSLGIHCKQNQWGILLLTKQMPWEIIVLPSLFMDVRQVTASLFVFLTSSGCRVLSPHVYCQLVKVDVTNQVAPGDRWYTESHPYRDLYERMFITTLFIIAMTDLKYPIINYSHSRW